MEDVQLPDGHKFPLLPCDLNVIFEIFSREACVGLLGLFSQSADLLDLGADIGSATALYRRQRHIFSSDLFLAAVAAPAPLMRSIALWCSSTRMTMANFLEQPRPGISRETQADHHHRQGSLPALPRSAARACEPTAPKEKDEKTCRVAFGGGRTFFSDMVTMQRSALWVLAFFPCCVDAASLRRSKMTFIEEQMSMQMKLMMPERATLNNIEASVLNMAKLRQSKHGEGGSNLTGFLDQIQDLIDKTMKTNIVTRQNQTQLDLDTAWANLSTCPHPNDTDFVDTLAELDKGHTECRTTQDTMWSTYKQTCITEREIFENEKKAICDQYKSINVFPNPTTTCVMAEGTAVPTIGNYLTAMEEHFTKKHETLKEWKDKCDTALATPFPGDPLCFEKVCTYYDKKIDCDKQQATFEQKSCDLHRTYRCSSYTSCYDQRKEGKLLGFASADIFP
ncbi:hypothetical protein AK812_SmicGene31200 [Symbiodinium microadriaticum]|uniref:Uncharacterized protein n=1 Tax=Symbiodinium microadriaticum TaxID=2951 RepID=A0A1Q9CXD0_SYMMI|nr:hypothetical protein AK812_SmicGene31200 [Symbiodinium microadriaticum]